MKDRYAGPCADLTWEDIVERVRRKLWRGDCVECSRRDEELINQFGLGGRSLADLRVPGSYIWSEARSSPPELAEALRNARRRFLDRQYQQESALRWLDRNDISPPYRLDETFFRWQQQTLPNLEKRLRWEFGSAEEEPMPQETPGESASLAAADPETEAQPPVKTKRGRKFQYDWEDARNFAEGLIRENGPFREWDAKSGWQCQADLESKVSEYMDKHGGAPSESILRRHVSAWLKALR